MDEKRLQELLVLEQENTTLRTQLAKLQDKVAELGKENTYLRAAVVKAGVCVYGHKDPGAPMATCSSGFPGCACMDDLMASPDFWDSIKQDLDRDIGPEPDTKLPH